MISLVLNIKEYLSTSISRATERTIILRQFLLPANQLHHKANPKWMQLLLLVVHFQQIFRITIFWVTAGSHKNTGWLPLASPTITMTAASLSENALNYSSINFIQHAHSLVVLLHLHLFNFFLRHSIIQANPSHTPLHQK